MNVPPMNSVLDLPDSAFLDRWAALTDDERSAVGEPGFQRRRRLMGTDSVRGLNGYSYTAPPPPPPAPYRPFEPLAVDALLSRRAPQWLAQHMSPRTGMTAIIGASGSGKTFLVLSVVTAVAANDQRWHDRRITPGLVLWINGEGNLKARLLAILEDRKLRATDLDMQIIDEPVNLLDPQAVAALIDAVQAIRANNDGVPIAAVVFDTLARCMPGGDENSARDMSMAIGAIGQIASAAGGAAIVVHHIGKDAARGARGHSSLRAAADAELVVERLADGTRTLSASKLRDAPDGEVLLRFRLRSVDLGPADQFELDADPGERVTSCVVEPVMDATPANRSRAEPKGANQRIVLKLLREMCADTGELLPETSAIPGGAKGVRLERFSARLPDVLADEKPWRARDRGLSALNSLVAGGHAGRHGVWVWTT